MTGFIRLESFSVNGGAIRSVNWEVDLNGVRVAMKRPYIPVGPTLAITPVLDIEGSCVRIRMDQWSPITIGVDMTAMLPIQAPQAIAVRAGHAFEADPGISWRSPADEIEAWAVRYVASLAETGEQS